MKIISVIAISILFTACGGGGGGGGKSDFGSLSSSSQSAASVNHAPSAFAIQATYINKNSVRISWLNSTDPDGDVLKYHVYVNNQMYAENLVEKVISLDELLPNTQQEISIEAVDTSGLITRARLNVHTRNDGGELSLRTAQIDASVRNYVVFKPENSEEKKLPLVIWFHGAGYQLPSIILQDYWIELAQREKFYLLAPLAISDQYETFTYWNAGLGNHKDDVLLTKTAIESLAAQGDIDTDRVYAAGMSSGGHMAFYTAFQLQDQIAAVAPIAGSIATYTLYPTPSSPGVFNVYQLYRPMPICHIHGDADSIVSINGGTWYASWKDIRSLWINTNKVDSVPKVINLPDTNKNDASTVTKYEYRGASPASDIDDYLIRQGRHSIPGIESVANQDINAYDVIWEFFKQHKLSDSW